VAIDDLTSSARRRPDSNRRSGARALVFWLVALTAGGAAAMLLRFYMQASSRAAPVLAKVLVASMDLPIATTLRAEHLKEMDWPETAQPPGSIHDVKDALGRVVITKLVKGESILVSKLASKDAGRGLAALIPESMRAVAVRVDDVVGVAGFVHPEDRVDVIVTMRPSKPSDAEPISKVILQNVKVLAVGKEIESNDTTRNKPMPVTVATLLVTPDDSEKLALAASQGKLLLTLRSWSDSATVETPGVVPTAMMANASPPVVAKGDSGDDARRRSRSKRDEPPPPAVAATPAAPPPRKDTVEILRGDRFEERKFDSKEKQ
jgi:pilus assembly protein CpaB